MHNDRSLLRKQAVFGCVILAVMLSVCFLGGCSEGEGDTDTTTVATSAMMLEAPASSADLYCLEFNSYSGVFVEDGKNEEVQDIAAILVENRSKVFLDRATIRYRYGADTATFVVTGLPAGEKCWVMEANKMPLDGKHEFEFIECVSAFKEDAVLTTDKLTVDAKDNTLTVTNTSKEVLKNVCVYYKNTFDDGNYFGGITYMMAFDNLSPGESLQKESGHFTDTSEIVRYSFQTDGT